MDGREVERNARSSCLVNGGLVISGSLAILGTANCKLWLYCASEVRESGKPPREKMMMIMMEIAAIPAVPRPQCPAETADRACVLDDGHYPATRHFDVVEWDDPPVVCTGCGQPSGEPLIPWSGQRLCWPCTDLQLDLLAKASAEAHGISPGASHTTRTVELGVDFVLLATERECHWCGTMQPVDEMEPFNTAGNLACKDVKACEARFSRQLESDRRCREIRQMIAGRGWTEEITRIASMRVALAMEAEGLPVPAPEVTA